MGLLYTRITDPLWAIPMILIEATGFAMLNPALYAVVAANSPPGRSSTAQGLFGAAGTVGFIVASLLAGVLAETDIVYPMYVFSAVLTVTLVGGSVVLYLVFSLNQLRQAQDQLLASKGNGLAGSSIDAALWRSSSSGRSCRPSPGCCTRA